MRNKDGDIEASRQGNVNTFAKFYEAICTQVGTIKETMRRTTTKRTHCDHAEDDEKY